jgi:hypothetical protein
MTHTLGPWRIDFTADNGHMADQVAHNSDWLAVEVVDDDIGGHVAYCHHSNAPLIAAAPELLAALKQCAEIIAEEAEAEVNENVTEAYYDALRALAKAEGRGE